MKLSRSLRSVLIMLICAQTGLMSNAVAQDCTGFNATATPTESRCTATGTMKFVAAGGSGNYNYSVNGAVSSGFTSSSTITGLPPGTYAAYIKDVVTGCIIRKDSTIVIGGSYQDPRFGISETDVTCSNGSDGTVFVSAVTSGRAPFTYKIVAPSAMGIGTTNGTGTFTGLKAGSYSIQLTDSCGGLQTRNISIHNFTWNITSAPVTLIACTGYQVTINLADSRGNTNSSGTAFAGYEYGYVNAPGDTVWAISKTFPFDLGQKRQLTLLAKDPCGNVQTKIWVNTVVPAVAPNVTISNQTCFAFDLSIGGKTNLSNPVFCLYDGLGIQVGSCNGTGTFTGLPYGAYCMKIYNTCYDTLITRCFNQLQPAPAVSGTATLTNFTCTTFDAKITGQQNLINPTYCLFNTSNVQVGACNSTGVFTGLPFGTYAIKVTDACTGQVFTIIFTGTKKVKTVAASVTMSGYTCTDFDVKVTGQSNLNNPQYCLVDSVGNPITCNSTGIFTDLPYGSYCINITDACADTTIKRCFTGVRPVPVIGAPTISNKNCNGFTVTVTGQQNIFNGLYCLQDNLGNPIAGIPCNSTGVFNNVPYGSYCVKVTDGCSGILLTSCFTVTAPTPSVGPAVISDEGCQAYTVTVSNRQNLTSPTFCIFDSLGNQLGTCNSTGSFVMGLFGKFDIVTTDACGNIFHSPYTKYGTYSAMADTVTYSNQTCATFSASVTGQVNLDGATFAISDDNGVILATNSTGIFNNLVYGYYCIQATTSCDDTIITRCFQTTAPSIRMNLTPSPSCTFSTTDIDVNISFGLGPFIVNIYDSADNLLRTDTSVSSHFKLTGVPTAVPGQVYKVMATGYCGSPVTAYVNAQPSYLTHDYTVKPKCPSSITLNGSSDLVVTATSNLQYINMALVRKDGSSFYRGFNTHVGDDFTFSDLDNATYVIEYTFGGCTTKLYDSFSLPNYQFPNLARSAAYQCDNNSFSVGAAVSGGIDPFTYQIIGSIPASPSITTAPQTSPVFSITNGVEYSLVRLRAIDACGNAALNDVSILPLANSIVTATSTCIHQTTTLSTDGAPNATYMWYRKTNVSATDSTLVGTDQNLTLTDLTPADTGIYVNRMSVNNGCLTKLSYFHLDGSCNTVLPGTVHLQGKVLGAGVNQLNWTTNASVYSQFLLERKKADGSFELVGGINVLTGTNTYNFLDNHFTASVNEYRLRLLSIDGKTTYSNIVRLGSGADDNSISIYPNPVDNVLHISIDGSATDRFQAVLFNVAGQMIYNSTTTGGGHSVLTYNRNSAAKGLYFLKVNNLTTGSVMTFKVVFK